MDTVETRAYEKMVIRLQELIEDAVEKANLLLKMSVPEAYKIQQIEGMQREMSRQKSEIVRLETSSNAMKDNELPLR